MPKISALDTIESIGEADQLPINDVSAVTTKKITVGQLLSQIYPIGSIYTNAAINTNPAELLGFGTWEEFAAGRVLVGTDPLQTEFDTLGETGGSKTHTHTLNDGYARINNQSGVAAVMQRKTGIPNWTASAAASAGEGSSSATGVGGTQLAGSTDAGSTLQPYITVYMWRRTA